MDNKTKKKLKKTTKKVGKKIIKAAKKEPKKAAIVIVCIILVIGIILASAYFMGMLDPYLPNSSEPSTSEPISSEPESVEPEDESTKSTISRYLPDTPDASDPDNGGLRDEDVVTIESKVNSYYASIDSTYKGETLWNKLFDITVPTYLTTYGDLRYGEKGNPYADMSISDQNKLVDFYSGALVNVEWNGGKNWNREHVWCQSHGWWGNADNKKANGGSDLHHLRPEIPNINSSRNNSLYGEVTDRENSLKKKEYTHEGTKYLYGYLDGNIDTKPGNSVSEGLFEPTDRVKGDVARIVMYLLVRYKDVATPVTNIIYTETGTPEAAYDLLLKWHNADPVSNFEIRRNQRTFEIQGNRNPFIDYPHYANYIWGD